MNNTIFQDNEIRFHKDDPSRYYFGDWAVKEGQADSYNCKPIEDWQEDITLINKEIMTDYEIKTCNYDYTETSMLAENLPNNFSFDYAPQYIPRNDYECNEMRKIFSTKDYKPSESERRIPQNVKGKNLFVCIDASNKGEVMTRGCKARKMLVGDWGLCIEFANGLKIYDPKEFKDACCGFCWVHTWANKKGAQIEKNKKAWKLVMLIDLNKGRFYEQKLPKEIMWQSNN